MTHSFWWLVCDALAVYRLAILITQDAITNGLRTLIQRPYQRLQRRNTTRAMPKGFRWYLVELSTCPWCVSIWVAAGAIALTRLAPTVWQYAAIALACSAVAGFLAER
jgi:Protein of unknown function (DUF1360)